MGRKYGRLCIGRRPGGCFRVKRRRRTSSFGSSTAAIATTTAAQSAEFLSNKVLMISTGSSDGGGTSMSEDQFSMVNKNFEADQQNDDDDDDDGDDEKIISGNKIMVVVDSSLEAKGGLEWALSHTVQSQDTVVLLHVANKQDNNSNGKVNNLRATELLHSMKNTCERKRPGVKVEIELLQGKEKGPIIVEAAKRQKVSLLVLGQKRKRSIWWSLMNMWTRRGKRRDVADYCIENAQCMTIAVRRKNKKFGGYLITTKRHKNFWLLA